MVSWRTDPRRISGHWFAFRQTAVDVAPLFHAAGERSPSQRHGRWHRFGEGYAQYLALEPAGAWAELLRYERIRAKPRATEYVRRLWLVFVEETDVADLSTFRAYSDCGLDPGLAVGEHRPAEELANALRAAGYRGLLSPSAALPGGTNLTLFGERYEKVLMTRPDGWDNPNPRVRLGCHLAAEGAPPPDLIMHTCYRGMEHETYRAFLRSVGSPAPSAPP